MSSNTTTKVSGVSRPLVGLITLACLGAWVVIGLLDVAGAVDAESQPLFMWWAGFGRVGIVMFALWLALPTKGRPAAWANISKTMLIVCLLLVALVAIRPWIALPLVVLLAVVTFVLRPRARRRPQSRAG
jgi:hypothetical protein